MNRDTEVLKSLLAWLLDEQPNPETIVRPEEEDLLWANLDPLDSENFNLECSSQPTSDLENTSSTEVSPLSQEGQTFSFGEIPVVQDRFKALLKRRMEAEIQLKPPLFPWESEVLEYPDTGYEAIVPSHSPWLNQLKNLNLPAIPENVLLHIFESCSDMVHSSLREGVRLIRAVESLFPGQSQTLNEVASLVLLGPARGGSSLPSTYEQANATGQMQLSLLAAKEIINQLQFVVSAAQPTLDRQWLTALGLLKVQVSYQAIGPTPKLRIQCLVPVGGVLEMRCGQAYSRTHRPDNGYLSVEIFDPQPQQTYALEVRLDRLEEKPLCLAVCPQ